jgi:hypothetical protein
MWKLKKKIKMKRLIFVVDFFLPRQQIWFPYLKCRWLRGWGRFPPETPFHRNIWPQATPMITCSNILPIRWWLVVQYGEGNRNIDYQYWDHYDSLILNQCLSPLKLCDRFPLMARWTLYIFIMFMLSSFRDLLQISGYYVTKFVSDLRQVCCFLWELCQQ